MAVIEMVMCQSSTPVLSTIPLSNDTVQRRNDEMGDDVESQLVQILSKTDHALQIDESTFRDNEALLMGYVRFVHEKETKKETLFVISLPNQTQKPYRYLRLSRISRKLKGYQCRTLYSRHRRSSRHGWKASRIHWPHETRDSWCHSYSLFNPQTPSRG